MDVDAAWEQERLALDAFDKAHTALKQAKRHKEPTGKGSPVRTEHAKTFEAWRTAQVMLSHAASEAGWDRKVPLVWWLREHGMSC